MKKILFFLLISLNAFSFETAPVLEGIYKGKNLFFKPDQFNFSKVTAKYKFKVTINKNIDTLFEVIAKKEKYELLLDKYGFKVGDTVSIVTIPIAMLPSLTIANPTDLGNFKCSFETNMITLDPTGVIHWTNTEEIGIRKYEVQQFRWGRWIIIARVNSDGAAGTKKYSTRVPHFFGEDQVRIHETFGCYSKPFKIAGDMPEVTMPGCHDALIFSDTTLYEVFDKNGTLVLQGESNKVDISRLKPDVYYLNYDNKSTEIIKKK